MSSTNQIKIIVTITKSNTEDNVNNALKIKSQLKQNERVARTGKANMTATIMNIPI